MKDVFNKTFLKTTSFLLIFNLDLGMKSNPIIFICWNIFHYIDNRCYLSRLTENISISKSALHKIVGEKSCNEGTCVTLEI